MAATTLFRVLRWQVQCGQHRRSQGRSDTRKVAHSIQPNTLPVGNTLGCLQLTTRRAARVGVN